MTIADNLATFSTNPVFDQLPPEVIHEAKRAILDMLGCAIGAYHAKPSQIMCELANDIGGKPESTLIGSGVRTSCLNAILANGVMVRYLDFNDTYLIPVGDQVLGHHPGELIPAVIALAERQGTSGMEVLRTIVLGYELSARFNDSCADVNAELPTIEAKGWNVDSRGAFIMPILAGRLLGLSQEQIANAMGINGSHNMILGILDASGEPYSMTKNLRFPRTAHSGVISAMMAAKGYTGPTRIMEGNKGFISSVMRGEFDVDALTAPVERFMIHETIYKAVAADASTHGHVNATLELVKEHDIRPEDVVKVNVKAGSRCVEHTGDPVKKYPQNKESADHSSYYLTAIAILDRKVGPNQYTPEKWTSPQAIELIDKVTFEADPSLDKFGRAGISEIHTRQGKVYTKRIDYPSGDPRNPMSDAELEEKFQDMAQPFMSSQRIDDIFETIYTLDKLQSVEPLTKLFAFDGGKN